RSAEKGKAWEKVTTNIRHPDGDDLMVLKNSTPVIRMPDGKTLMTDMTIMRMRDRKTQAAGMTGGPALFSSKNNGITWEYLNSIAEDKSGQGRFTYSGLLLIPEAELQCYYLHIANSQEQVDGIKNAICMSVSKDAGKTWSDPVP